MLVNLKDVPLEGKVTGIEEDTVPGSFGRLELRTKLIVKNEFLGVSQSVSFLRPNKSGEILTSLIDDFKAGKEISIRGRTSYGLDNGMFLSKHLGLKELFKKVKLLARTTDWKQISQGEKELLGDFLSRIIIPVFGEVYLDVSIDDKAKYLITAGKDEVSSANILLFRGEPEAVS